MNRLLSLADELKDAYNEFRLARDCNVAALQQSIRHTHINGDPFDMLGANKRALSARKWLLDACEVAEFELRRSKCSASNLLRFIAAVRDGDSTPEAWQRVLDMWPDAYACVRDGSAEEYRVACEQQADPSNGDGATSVEEETSGVKKRSGPKRKYSLRDDKQVWSLWKSGNYKSFKVFLAECGSNFKQGYKTKDDMIRLQQRVKQRNKNEGA